MDPLDQGASLGLPVLQEKGGRQARVDLKVPQDHQEKGALRDCVVCRELTDYLARRVPKETGVPTGPKDPKVPLVTQEDQEFQEFRGFEALLDSPASQERMAYLGKGGCPVLMENQANKAFKAHKA